MKQYAFTAATPFEFELKDLSDITQRKQKISGTPHRTDFYQIVMLESGQSIQTVDFAPIKLDGGEILFIAKNQVVSFDTSGLHDGKIILFTDVFFNRCACEVRLLRQQNLFNPFTVNTPISVNEKLRTLFTLIEEEFHSEYDASQADIIHNLLSAFLIESARQSVQTTHLLKNQEYSIALQFAELVEQHYRSLRKVNDYLDFMPVAAKQLSKILQTIVGKTPKQFIDDRIVLEAKRLLVYGDESIKEITFLLGFEEPTNFSKFFREQTGLSPAEFKKQNAS